MFVYFTLKSKFSSWASSVPAKIEPIIIASAPAANAFAISPENLIPPSEIIFIFFLLSAFLPRVLQKFGELRHLLPFVVQMEPGPIPTFMISAPELYNFFAASPVAILPTQIGTLLAIFTLKVF